MTVSKRTKIAAAGVGAAALVAGALVVARVVPVPGRAAAKEGPGYSLVKVARGDLSASVTASGKLEPNTITAIRPDSNMPTRKLVSVLVREGQSVRAGEALARIDDSGLDLDLKSAKAALAAQRAKLDNLRAKPVDLDQRQADADLGQARINVESAQDAYDAARSLADKGLAPRSQLADAERQLSVAKLRLESARLSWQAVQAQSQADVIQAQEAAVAQAESELQKRQLVFDSATIRTPVDGVVAEIPVNVGDLVSPATALMTVVDPDPMLLQALVNENDMPQIRIGQAASVTPSGLPDLKLAGKITLINLHAQVQANVSVFQTTIEVPNRDRSLLWGMNADAEIAVLSLKDVLYLPANAVRTGADSAKVIVLDEGRQVSWDVQAGATDGARIQIVAGLDEGDEVVVAQRKPVGASTAGPSAPPGLPGAPPPQNRGMNQVFRALH